MISMIEFYEKYWKKGPITDKEKEFLQAIESGKKVHIIKGRTGIKFILA